MFSGYKFDTVGTRKGYELASLGMPLSLLGRYQHVLWMTDLTAGSKLGPSTDVIDGISLLRWMSAPARANTLSAYLSAGGKVWLAGGAAAYCSLIEYNNRNNDNSYGIGHTVFGTTMGELVGGRMMFDGAKWQSEMVWSGKVSSPVKSTAAIGGWSNPGQDYSGTINAPDYSRLPGSLRRRLLSLGDSLPPTRTSTQGPSFWTSGVVATEYLDMPNFVIEDINKDLVKDSLVSVLDTLFELQGTGLATAVTGNRPVAMTYYHGIAGPPFVFTGFSLWDWTKSDCVGLVDFVLNDIWGMHRAPGAPNRLGAPSRASGAGAAPQPIRIQPMPTAKRLPVGRVRGEDDDEARAVVPSGLGVLHRTAARLDHAPGLFIPGACGERLSVHPRVGAGRRVPGRVQPARTERALCRFDASACGQPAPGRPQDQPAIPPRPRSRIAS